MIKKLLNNFKGRNLSTQALLIFLLVIVVMTVIKKSREKMTDSSVRHTVKQPPSSAQAIKYIRSMKRKDREIVLIQMCPGWSRRRTVPVSNRR